MSFDLFMRHFATAIRLFGYFACFANDLPRSNYAKLYLSTRSFKSGDSTSVRGHCWRSMAGAQSGAERKR